MPNESRENEERDGLIAATATSQPYKLEAPRPHTSPIAVLGWLAAGVTFAAPVVCESLAQESGGRSQSAWLVLASLVVAAASAVVLAFVWRPIVDGIGNAGLATIALVAGLQFAVSYAARLIGYVVGAVLGPLYVFIDGIGSKGLSCLFLGMLVALLPRPGVLALSLITLFLLNVITSGQVGLVALVFVAVTVALHETLAALLGVTTGPRRRAINRSSLLKKGDRHLDASDFAAENQSCSEPVPLFQQAARADRSFAIRAGLAIGSANALALYAQYALFEILLRQFFDEWYKLAVALVTGLVFGGVGAAWGWRYWACACGGQHHDAHDPG